MTEYSENMQAVIEEAAEAPFISVPTLTRRYFGCLLDRANLLDRVAELDQRINALLAENVDIRVDFATLEAANDELQDTIEYLEGRARDLERELERPLARPTERDKYNELLAFAKAYRALNISTCLMLEQDSVDEFQSRLDKMTWL